MLMLRSGFSFLLILALSSCAGITYQKSGSEQVLARISQEQAVEIAKQRAAADPNGFFKQPYVNLVVTQSGTGHWVVKLLSAEPDPGTLGEKYMFVIIDKVSGSVISVESGGGS